MVEDYSKPYNPDSEPSRIIPKEDILNQDNLIPISPSRSCGTVRARLKFAGRDKPLPLPEGEIPLLDLDNLE